MRDDINTLPLSKAAKRYARLHTNTGKQALHIQVLYQLLNQGAHRPKSGFVNSDEGECSR